MKQNIACRIFKEQIDLIMQIPEQERAIVLYTAITNAFNQFDNQNENQNENAYISVSVSDSISVSAISRAVLNLLQKNIICKEFSPNYGGKRKGSGRPTKDKSIKCGYPSGDCKNLNKDCSHCKENEFSNSKSYDPYPPF
jgi:hypothetical protein